ncbi:MAG: pantoate--beta-alanine ligase [Bacteroidota bacterium]
MKVVTTEKELKALVSAERKKGRKIGFIPTMGALHKGHFSLVETAEKNSDYIILSVFVNPTQFNDKKDFEKYPRNIDNDLQLLKNKKVDVVFTPSEKEIYPKPDKRKFSFAKLDQVLEGKQRPGHFNGVAQVVSRLFSIVEPDFSFFGQKDYQQLLVIKELVKQLELKINIVACPTIRDDEGLALSSRNQFLSDEEYDEATFIPIWMNEVKKLALRYKVSQIKARVETLVSQHPQMKLDYFEICDASNLNLISDFQEAESTIALIAIYVGKVRLIDNIML